jgi:hypothetical protein
MRSPALPVLPCVLFALSLHGNPARPQSLPGFHRVERPMTVPLDRPVVLARKPIDPVQLQQDAEELARLSAAIPEQVKNVRQKLPKDLDDHLKQIEKLAKRLRSEIAH